MADARIVITFNADTASIEAFCEVFPPLWRRYGSVLDLDRLSPKARQLALGLLDGTADVAQAIASDLDFPTGGTGDALFTAEPSEAALELLLALRARDGDLEPFGQ